MLKLLSIIFLTFSAACVVDDAWYLTVRSKLKDRFMEDLYDSKKTLIEKKAIVDSQVKLVYGILSSSSYAAYTFFNLLGMGSFGTVFEGKKETGELVSIKIMFDETDKYKNCQEAYDSFKALTAKEGVKYVIHIDEPVFYEKYGLFACGMTMDRGYPTDKPLFGAGERTSDNKATTLKLVDFCVKLLESFYTINHLGGFYHGDVKPENTLMVKTEGGMEPRVIDFDLMFKKVTPHHNPGNIIYTLTYRPPELKKIVPKTNPTREQKVELRKYKYDADFREEAWSVGRTVAKIVETNNEFVDGTDPKLRQLLGILRDMTKDDINERICTEAAWERAAKILAPKQLVI